LGYGSEIMAILQYYCPKHHTTKRLTRFSGWIEGWYIGDGEYVRKASFKRVEPICQICRQKMVYAGSNLPKKKKKKKKKRKH